VAAAWRVRRALDGAANDTWRPQPRSDQEKSPRHCCLGLNPPFQKVEETSGREKAFPMQISLAVDMLRRNMLRP